MNLALLIYRKTKLTAQDNYTGVNQFKTMVVVLVCDRAPQNQVVCLSRTIAQAISLMDTTVNLYYVSRA